MYICACKRWDIPSARAATMVVSGTLLAVFDVHGVVCTSAALSAVVASHTPHYLCLSMQFQARRMGTAKIEYYQMWS